MKELELLKNYTKGLEVKWAEFEFLTKYTNWELKVQKQNYQVSVVTIKVPQQSIVIDIVAH